MTRLAWGCFAILLVGSACDGRPRRAAMDAGVVVSEDGGDDVLPDAGTEEPWDGSAPDGGSPPGLDGGPPPADAATAPRCTVTAETVDRSGGRQECGALAVDGDGNAHVVFYETGSDEVRYATNASGSWATGTLQEVGSLPSCALGIAVDAAGAVHVVFYDGRAAVRHSDYATNASGTWQLQNNFAHALNNIRMAFDSTGTLHVAGRFFDDIEIYSRSPSGAWTGARLDSNVGDMQRAALAIDGDDALHVAYFDTEDLLHYATNAGGAWTGNGFAGTQVDDGRAPSIAIAGGAVHIGYRDQVMGLLHVSNASGSWSYEVIDAAGYDVDLAGAGTGLPHGVYRHYVDGRSPDNRLFLLEGGGPSWSDTEIASPASTDPVQIRIGPRGESHVMYSLINTIRHVRVECP